MLPKITHKLSRENILYFVHNKKVQKFTGVNIPGFCVVVYNTDDIYIVPGVRSIRFTLPKHGVWGSGFKSWNEVVEFFNSNFPLPIIQEIVRAEFLMTARRLDEAAFASGNIPDRMDNPLLSRRKHRGVPKGDGKSMHVR